MSDFDDDSDYGEGGAQRGEANGTPFGQGGAKFADAVSKLLSRNAERSSDEEDGDEGGGGVVRHASESRGVRRAAAAAAASAPAPILANSRTAARALDAERAERLRAKAARKRKRELRAAGHAPPAARGVEPAADARERVLLTTATRGVVHLFNAVAKAQRERREAAAAGGARPAAAPKPSFLAELRRAAGGSEGAAAGAGAGPAGGAPGWDVLREGYGMGRTGLKEWDRGAAGAKSAGGAGGAALEGGGFDDSDLDDGEDE